MAVDIIFKGKRLCFTHNSLRRNIMFTILVIIFCSLAVFLVLLRLGYKTKKATGQVIFNQDAYGFSAKT